MDPGELFSIWSSSSSSSSQPTVSFSATLCSGPVPSGNFEKYRLIPIAELDPMIQKAVHEGVLYVSLPVAARTSAEPMDVVVVEGCEESSSSDGRVFLNAQSIRMVKSWRDTVGESMQHVLPESPFIIYSGTPKEPASSGVVAPGYHRVIEWDPSKLTWVSTRNRKEERRLKVTMTQRQWNTDSDLRSDPKPIKMSMFIWEDQCAQLGVTSDLTVWKDLMRCNPVPFYAMVAENKTYGKKNGELSLSTFAVQWDLSTYLTKHCVALPFDTVRKLIKGTTSSSDQQIVNMTECGSAPTGSGWRYFAMTADPTNIKTPDQVVDARCAKVLFAVRSMDGGEKPKKKSKGNQK